MSTVASQYVFAVAAIVLLYVYVGFPILLIVWSRVRPRPVRDDGPPAPVTVVLAAHDEAGVIGSRIENLLAQDYPPEELQVVVACDGGGVTYDEAAGHAGEQVEVLALPRVGKAAAMNAAVARARHDIIAFTDANSVWDSQALRRLVAPFADPEVGGVAGDQQYVGGDRTDPVASGESAYWNLDRRLKRAQTLIHSVTSATGAIHALRREHVEEIPGGVTDDFFLSTGAVLAGRRLVFAPDARAFETLAPSRGAEFARKTRIMTRGLRSVQARSGLLNPRRHGFYALQLFTHKVLRRLVYIPLGLLAISSLIGMGTVPWLRVAATAQGMFYAIAALGLLLPDRRHGRVVKILHLPAFYCLVYAAAAVATVRVLRGDQVDRWGHRRLGPEREDSATVNLGQETPDA